MPRLSFQTLIQCNLVARIRSNGKIRLTCCFSLMEREKWHLVVVVVVSVIAIVIIIL